MYIDSDQPYHGSQPRLHFEMVWLEGDLEEEEISEALADCTGGQPLGPDV